MNNKINDDKTDAPRSLKTVAGSCQSTMIALRGQGQAHTRGSTVAMSAWRMRERRMGKERKAEFKKYGGPSSYKHTEGSHIGG